MKVTVPINRLEYARNCYNIHDMSLPTLNDINDKIFNPLNKFTKNGTIYLTNIPLRYYYWYASYNFIYKKIYIIRHNSSPLFRLRKCKSNKIKTNCKKNAGLSLRNRVIK